LLVIQAIKEAFAIIYRFAIEINMQRKEEVEDCK